MSELLSWTTDPDCRIIPRLLSLHAPARDPLVIVDVTANRGYMWRGTGLTPIRCDIDPAQRPDVVADCRALPFAAGSVDVLVFDPPHIPGPGLRHTARDWVGRYGAGMLPSLKSNGVETLFTPFLREARRVLAPGGIILAKLADGVYHDRMRFHHSAFLGRVDRLVGLTACDLVVKVRGSPGTAWPEQRQTQFHHRAAHSYWIVVRKGSCQGAGLARPVRPQQPTLFTEDVA